MSQNKGWVVVEGEGKVEMIGNVRDQWKGNEGRWVYIYLGEWWWWWWW